MRIGLQPNNFDLLRLFAAFQVVLVHTVKQLQLTESPAYALLAEFHGVPIFFVLSGFLISAAWERNPDIGNFARNRTLRIFPGLWVCVICTTLVASLFGFSILHNKGITWALLQGVGLIYTPGFLSGFGFGSYNGSLWTIPIELQFYVVIPIIYLISRRIGTVNGWVVAGFIVTLIFALFYASVAPQITSEQPEQLLYKLIRYSFAPHIYMFFAGVIIQRLSLHASPYLASKGLYWVTAYLLLVWLTPENKSVQVFERLMLGITAISAAYTLPGLASKCLGTTDISYGVYIYHGLLLNIFVQMDKVGSWQYGASLFVFTGALGYLSWVLVERPCIKRKLKTVRGLQKNHADKQFQTAS